MTDDQRTAYDAEVLRQKLILVELALIHAAATLRMRAAYSHETKKAYLVAESKLSIAAIVLYELINKEPSNG